MVVPSTTGVARRSQAPQGRKEVGRRGNSHPLEISWARLPSPEHRGWAMWAGECHLNPLLRSNVAVKRLVTSEVAQSNEQRWRNEE